MEGNSSGEEMVVVKTRKPYTITKQREKWTEDEHNRFLEALKLYGRAWQRIEEHIGSKTAVQIRSHAQKFFTKLEKEALQKGIPTGQANEIDIPPPRPKKKPSSPYPRKSNSGAFASRDAKNIKTLKSKSRPTNEEIDEDAAQENFAATQKLKSVDISEDPNHSEVLHISQDDLSVSISSAKKSSSNHHGKYMVFLPTKEKMDELENKASVSHELDQDLENSDKVSIGQETDVLGIFPNPHVSLATERRESTSKLQVFTSKDTEKGEQILPHKPVVHMKGRYGADGRQTEDSVDQNHALIGQVGGNGVGGNGNAKPPENAVASAIQDQNVPAMGFMHNPMPFFSPFPYSHSIQDIYRSFLNNPSAFSSLISYTLLQNPAAQVSARMAASFWPSAEVVTSLHPTPDFLAGENPERNTNPTPSLEAIATVTVAAATAWWAAQGLLSWFPSVDFAFSRPNTTATPSVDEAQPHGHGTSEDLLKEQKFTNHNQCDDRKPPHQSSKPMPLSLPESNGIGRAENLNESTRSNMFESLEASGFHDTDEGRNNKKLNRSSCGSNTSYSGNIEADNIEKPGKSNTAATDLYFSNSTAFETNNRRTKCSGCTTESWKEVSEEGRLAFQELFRRQVLPQSFSPPHAKEAATAIKMGETSKLLVDLNRSLCSAANHNNPHAHPQGQTRITNNGSQTIGKLKVQCTGFKPYKRCSIEAKENGAAAEEKSGNKRVRLQGQDANGFC